MPKGCRRAAISLPPRRSADLACSKRGRSAGASRRKRSAGRGNRPSPGCFRHALDRPRPCATAGLMMACKRGSRGGWAHDLRPELRVNRIVCRPSLRSKLLCGLLGHSERSDRLLRGDDFGAADVADGSSSAGRARDLNGGKLTPNLSHRIADVHDRQWSTLSRLVRLGTRCSQAAVERLACAAREIGKPTKESQTAILKNALSLRISLSFLAFER